MILENLLKKWNDKILILGNGYIGNILSNYLGGLGELLGSKDFNYHDTKLLFRYCLNKEVKCIINCSGFTGKPNVDEAEDKKELCWRLNVESPLNINRLCDYYGIRYIHISSGCIYNGYEKDYSETDVPNFGMFDHSSFYSKTKHEFERLASIYANTILRIRMPICDDLTNPRNYLHKILKYPKLIDKRNSKTYIPDLCKFIGELLYADRGIKTDGIYNVVNDNPLTTKRVIQIINSFNKIQWHPEWVNEEDLNLKAPRSNCVLDNTKATQFMKFMTEEEVLEKVIANL